MIDKSDREMVWRKHRIIAVAIFVIPWFFWAYAIGHASASGFTEDELAVQLMVLGGAVSMVAAVVSNLWE